MQGPRAVLGPGTGLGEAQLIWDEKFEGAHIDHIGLALELHDAQWPFALQDVPSWAGSLSQSHCTATCAACLVVEAANGLTLASCCQLLTGSSCGLMF